MNKPKPFKSHRSVIAECYETNENVEDVSEPRCIIFLPSFGSFAGGEAKALLSLVKWLPGAIRWVLQGPGSMKSNTRAAMKELDAIESFFKARKRERK